MVRQSAATYLPRPIALAKAALSFLGSSAYALKLFLGGERVEAQMELARALVREAIPLLKNATKQDMLRFLKILELIARRKLHKDQLRQLQRLVEQDHPAIGLLWRLFREANVNCLQHLFEGLGVNAVWLGHIKRREFVKRHGFIPPFLILISPTMRCNLNCIGCYAGLYPRTKDPMSFETLERIIREGKEMAIYFYTITGGEPFIREDLLDLYELHNDCIFQVYTNGTLFTPKLVERLAELGNVYPAISIEGYEEQTDTRRGKGVFRKVMDAMDMLREAGIIFGFSTTVTRYNADVVSDISFYDFLIEKGCMFGWTFLYVPVGKDDDPDMMVTPKQRDKLRRVELEVRETRPLAWFDFWSDAPLTDGCLAAGRLYLHINYRGDIEPCVFAHFATHNIHNCTLVEALQSPFFREYRRLQRACKNRLRPCIIIDHNELLEEVIRKTNARPTHDGAEAIITCHAQKLRSWSAEYAKLADKAWESEEYEWARNGWYWAWAEEEDELEGILAEAS